MSFPRSILKDDSGASAAEWGLIGAVVICAIALVGFQLGDHLRILPTSAIDPVNGQNSRDPIEWIAEQERVEGQLRRTRPFDVVYSEKGILEYDVSQPFPLVVASSDLDDAITEVVEQTGSYEIDRAHLTLRVRANLTSDSPEVEIFPQDGITRTLRPSENASFVWNVTPRTIDAFKLRLELTNLAVVDGVEHTAPQPAWTADMLVNATILERATFRWNNLDVLWQIIAIILAMAPIGGAIWRRWKSTSQVTTSETSDKSLKRTRKRKEKKPKEKN